MSNVPTFHIADLWEIVVAAVPDRTALVCGSQRRTFREIDDRASRLASWMNDKGISPGSHVGVQMLNIVEHVESALAIFKLRASPININYRLTASELQHLYDDAGLEGLVHDTPPVEPSVDRTARAAGVKWTLSVGDAYEHAIGISECAELVARSGDDRYVLFTGGTTGRPKGVVWRVEDAFFACIGGGDPRGESGPITTPTEIAERIVDDSPFLPAAPLMHAAGMWTTLRWLLAGSTVVLIPTFEAGTVLEAIETEGVATMNIVGDAMAMRLVRAIEDAPHRDLSSLKVIASGGAPLTASVRTRLIACLPHVRLRDSYGSSETGVHGWSTYDANDMADERFLTRDTVVVDPDDLTLLPAPNSAPGHVARHRHIPLRYHHDPEASARTFVQIGAVKYAVTGDLGYLDRQGRLTLLGRGTSSINSGGEKIHPEEVEAVLRGLPHVQDCLVLGVADSHWGQRVVALVEMTLGAEVDDAAMRAHCKLSLAGYKVPKEIVQVEAIPRTPAGKPDFQAALTIATATKGEAK